MVKLIEILEPVAWAIVLALALAGCTLVTEWGDSSGCMWTEGGPVPGMSSGKVLVCRSGKDNASVAYEDGERRIIIEHLP